ncbi:MAG TPA: DUF4342 domain-containing protein [Rhizobiaceae bacterium]|nr:DUF4342 domain-containing protein [Rhizobiaceae bacterium]
MTSEKPQANDQQQKHTITEEIEIAGAHLVERVKEIIEEGNVRQLKIVASDGDTYLETPLTIGVVAGGVVALAAPWLAVLGVLAALVARVRVVVEREVEGSTPESHPASGQKDAPDA